MCATGRNGRYASPQYKHPKGLQARLVFGSSLAKPGMREKLAAEELIDRTRLTIEKISGILKPLAAFLRDPGTVYMKDVKTEHLFGFSGDMAGFRKDRDTGEFVRQPKSQLGKRKNQEFLKMFSCRARELRWIAE